MTTRYSDDTENNAIAAEANVERARADKFAARLVELKRRIRTFADAVDYVSFPQRDTAPAWSDAWEAFLVHGDIPEPVVVEEVVNDGDADVVIVDAAAVAEFESAEVVELVNTDTGAGDLEVPAAVDFESDAAELDTVIENGVEIPTDQAG